VGAVGPYKGDLRGLARRLDCAETYQSKARTHHEDRRTEGRVGEFFLADVKFVECEERLREIKRSLNLIEVRGEKKLLAALTFTIPGEDI